MAIDRNIAIALQIRTDLNKARADIDALDRAVDDLGATGKATGADLGTVGKQIDQIGQRASKVGQDLNAAGAKLRSFDQNTAKVGVSAGQTANAMRQLPAQITDIVTGLTTGQSVFQVAIQQGGQLRDSFGSVGGVLRGFASLISPATLGIGVLAAVVGTLALGVAEGFSEQQRYNTALAATGGYAGETGAQLAQLATRIGETQGAYGDATEAVSLLAESGRVTGAALDDAARGAVAFAQLTGKSIDDAVAKILELSKDPVQAIRALDSQYHFLEASVYSQIQALQEQGRESEAQALAQRTVADAMEERRARDVQNLAAIQSAWRSLGAEIAGVWNEIKQGGQLLANLGSQATAQQLDQLYFLRGYYQSIGFGLGDRFVADVDKQIAALKDRAAAEQAAAKAEADHRQVQEDGVAALDRIAASTTKYATAADRYKKELDDINKNFDTAIKAMPEKAAELNAQRASQIKSAADAYAEKLLQESRSAAAERRAAERKAEAEAQTAANAQQGLLQSLSQMQGELDPTAAAWVRYNQAVNQANEQAEKAKAGPRANVAAINAERDAVITLAAAVRDAALDKLAEKDRKAWESLRESLRTPTEVKVETAIDQIKQLNGFLANGTITAQQYHDALQRVGTNSVIKAPEYQGVDAAVGGPAGELGKNFKAQADLETWHAQQLAANEAFHQQDLANEEVYQARKAEIEQQYSQQRTQITQAQQQLALAAASDGFANLANMAKSAYGEQSAQYRALFALSKAFAIAQAAISLGINVAKASETGFPYNIGFIAGAIAQGVQIASIISGASFSGGGSSGSSGGQGFAEGGYTGPGGKYQVAGYVHAGEGVLSQEDIAGLGGPAGFYALRNAIQNGSLRLPGYADGGFVSPVASAPRLAAANAPKARIPEGADVSAGPVVHNNFRFLTAFDASDLAEKILATPAAEKLVVQHVIANGSSVRSGISN